MPDTPVRVTPIRGLMDRLVGAVADRVAPAVVSRVSEGFAGSWFGPGQPLPARAPAGEPPRAWQYPPGVNIYTQPRGSEAVSFPMLRNLADGCDMVRICIEMRKDQLAGLDWDITAKIKGEGDQYTAEIAAAKRFFERPDGEHSWDGWLRICLEDVLVLDALSLFRRRTRGGQLFALEPVDGSSVKPLIDAYGRRPGSPLPAYQQILNGMPYVDLTADDLLYRPRNPRSNSVYGSSPVEWIILTVNGYLRRQLFNLSYYTDGNVPEGFGTVPEGWTPDQIRQFQEWFDALLAGNDQERRRFRFVGHGFEFKRMREMNFEVAFEEWFARVITAAFQVNYQRFIQRVVRATAEQAAAEQGDLGIEPLKRFLSGIINEILERDFGMPFLQHAFLGGEQQDETAETNKRIAYVGAGIMSRDEVRDLDGLEPWGLPMTAGPTVTTAAGPVLLEASALAAPGRESRVTGPGSDSGDPQPTTRDSEPAAAKSALAQWRRKALRAFRDGKAERGLEFSTAAVPPAVQAAVRRRLAAARDEGEIAAAFEGVAAGPFWSGQGHGPRHGGDRALAAGSLCGVAYP